MTNAKSANTGLDQHAENSMAVYRDKIRPLVYPQHKGRQLVLEPESGDYEVADQAITASQKLRERHPEALFFTIKIGYKASLSFGGQRLPEEDC